MEAIWEGGIVSMGCSWRARSGRTFPNARPENITIVDIHHDPLAIQRILVDWAEGTKT